MHTTTDAILYCQVSAWLPNFEHLCYRRRLLQLSKEFVEYLVADRVFSRGNTQLFGERRPEESNSDSDSDSASSSEGGEAEEPFPEVLHQIQVLVDELGGKVVPKLSWSAPRDAIWLSPEKNLKCTSADEVVLFLKSSDRVAHDICSPFDAPSPLISNLEHVLCLSKFYELMPHSEFRCFVKHRQLIAVSQREITQYFPQLHGEEDRIRNLCRSWFKEHIQSRFTLTQYSFDVYITSNDRVKLLDFNAVCATSSPLLFTWEELGLDPENQSPEHSGAPLIKKLKKLPALLDEGSVDVRFVQDDGSIMMGPALAVSMPYDMVGCSLTEALQKMQTREEQ